MLFIKWSSSFGPTESWRYLCLIDARQLENDIFKIYFIDLPNDSDIWQSLKVNSTDTYLDQCNTKRRPRINPNSIFEQLKEKNKEAELLCTGSLKSIMIH
jgi:hypothetical protein